MNEIIRDPIWQFVGVLLALLAIVLAVAFYLWQRKKKSLDYHIVYDAKLFDEGTDYADFLVTYCGNLVQDVGIVAIRIFNSGDIPIEVSDFDQPLSFRFSDSVRVLSVEQTYADPNNLAVHATIENNVVKIEPALLNKNDQFELKFVLSGPQTTLSIDARIVGVSRIGDRNVKPLIISQRSFVIGFFIATIGFSFILARLTQVGIGAAFALIMLLIALAIYLQARSAFNQGVQTAKGSMIRR